MGGLWDCEKGVPWKIGRRKWLILESRLEIRNRGFPIIETLFSQPFTQKQNNAVEVVLNFER